MNDLLKLLEECRVHATETGKWEMVSRLSDSINNLMPSDLLVPVSRDEAFMLTGLLRHKKHRALKTKICELLKGDE